MIVTVKPATFTSRTLKSNICSTLTWEWWRFSTKNKLQNQINMSYDEMMNNKSSYEYYSCTLVNFPQCSKGTSLFHSGSTYLACKKSASEMSSQRGGTGQLGERRTHVKPYALCLWGPTLMNDSHLNANLKAQQRPQIATFKNKLTVKWNL